MALSSLEVTGKDEEEKKMRKKNYQLWQGKHQFCCRGFIVLGPDTSKVLVGFFLPTVMVVLFLIFVCPYFDNSLLLLFVSLLLYIGTLGNMLRTTFIDPGLLPRSNKLEASNRDKSSESHSTLNFCHVCQIVQEGNARHCRYCDACVAGFDHHCPWIGNCVGSRNYRYFIGFLCFSMMALGFFGVLGSYQLIDSALHSKLSLLQVVKENIPVLILILLCVTLGVMLGVLFVFHLYLIYFGMTTNQFLRRRQVPTSRSAEEMNIQSRRQQENRKCSNFVSLFCSPVPESQVRQWSNNNNYKMDLETEEISISSV